MFQKKVKQDAMNEHILSADFYKHRAIMNAMLAPTRALEAEKFNDGLVSAQLSVFLLEKFAWADGTLKDEEPELLELIEKEKKKILAEGLDLTNERALTRIAYAKLAWIFKKIHKAQPSNTGYKV